MNHDSRKFYSEFFQKSTRGLEKIFFFAQTTLIMAKMVLRLVCAICHTSQHEQQPQLKFRISNSSQIHEHGALRFAKSCILPPQTAYPSYTSNYVNSNITMLHPIKIFKIIFSTQGNSLATQQLISNQLLIITWARQAINIFIVYLAHAIIGNWKLLASEYFPYKVEHIIYYLYKVR